MTTFTSKPNGTGLRRIINATRCSLEGLKAAWQSESAFRQEVVMVLLMLPFSFVIAQSALHWMLLIFSLLFVLFAEIVNSALEAVCDAVTQEHQPLIGKAKDMGSSAVFIALSFIVIVWADATLRFFQIY